MRFAQASTIEKYSYSEGSMLVKMAGWTPSSAQKSARKNKNYCIKIAG
jgi:hypothetical protein